MTGSMYTWVPRITVPALWTPAASSASEGLDKKKKKDHLVKIRLWPGNVWPQQSILGLGSGRDSHLSQPPPGAFFSLSSMHHFRSGKKGVEGGLQRKSAVKFPFGGREAGGLNSAGQARRRPMCRAHTVHVPRHTKVLLNGRK